MANLGELSSANLSYRYISEIHESTFQLHGTNFKLRGDSVKFRLYTTELSEANYDYRGTKSNSLETLLAPRIHFRNSRNYFEAINKQLTAPFEPNSARKSNFGCPRSEFEATLNKIRPPWNHIRALKNPFGAPCNYLEAPWRQLRAPLGHKYAL